MNHHLNNDTGSKFLFDQGHSKFNEEINLNSPQRSHLFAPHLEYMFMKGVSNGVEESNGNPNYLNIKSNFSGAWDFKSKFSLAESNQQPHALGEAFPQSSNIKISSPEASPLSNKDPKASRRKFERSQTEPEDSIPGLIKKPITKIKDAKSGASKGASMNNQDTIFLRFYPKDLTTKSLMLKLNNFPRLEIKTSKKNNLKKILDHMRKKWLSKINSKNCKFDIQITPNPKTWLRHLEDLDKKLGLPQVETHFSENLMLSDIWSGYNEPNSNKIDLIYEIVDSFKNLDMSSFPPMFSQLNQGVHSTVNKGFKPTNSQNVSNSEKNGKKSAKNEGAKKQAKAEVKAETKTPEAKSEIKAATKPEKKTDAIPEIRIESEPTFKKETTETNSQKGEIVETKSNSAFKLNERNDSVNKFDSLKGPAGNSEQSLKMIYNHIDEVFPDSQNFTSLLKTNEAPTNFTNVLVKKITVNRKAN